MVRKIIYFIISLTVTISFILVLNNRSGMLPPAGKFFSPFEGFWHNIEGESRFEDVNIKTTNVDREVSIIYDDHGVPHVFAESLEGLYFAQGYVMAKDRLWQMEFTAMAAGGRLSEIIGRQAIGHDRNMRNAGMVLGAENGLENVMNDSLSKSIIKAFTDGINAYIENISPQNLPIEYRLLNYYPELWTPLKTMLIQMQISHRLTARSNALQMTNTLDRFGPDFLKNFFPQYADFHEYYIPDEGQFDFDPLVAEPPDTFLYPKAVMHASNNKEVSFSGGSNTWAVDGSKTLSGYPLLANDPHLELSLPSIWYEMQLNAPGLNVYGVTLAGVPGIIIGFNEAVSWGITNSNTDAMDIFKIEFEDESRERYLYNGEWHFTQSRTEEIKIRNGASQVDTILMTHHGPVYNFNGNAPDVPENHALKWAAHNPGNELLAFYKMNTASSLEAFESALESFHVPSQTLSYADTSGNIATFINGRLPVRWKGQGRFISDGSDPAYDWQKMIPQEHMPKIVNPQRGYIASANQPPAGDYYPYDISWLHKASSSRGSRIRSLLENADSLNSEDFIEMQTDNYSYEAASILPYLLKWMNHETFNNKEQEVFFILENWDYQYDTDAIAPYIFHHWWFAVYDSVWAPYYRMELAELRKPSRERTAVELITSPFKVLWTPEHARSIPGLVRQTFANSVNELYDAHGEPGEDWYWGNHSESYLLHLAKLDAFSRYNLAPGGVREAINANDGNFGPSWRMVVDMKPPVSAWGIYPGGSSGNPGSEWYDHQTEYWEKGALKKLNFWNHPDQAEGKLHIIIEPVEN